MLPKQTERVTGLLSEEYKNTLFGGVEEAAANSRVFRAKSYHNMVGALLNTYGECTYSSSFGPLCILNSC